MRDYELIAQELSNIGDRLSRVENSMSDLLARMAAVENVNSRLEEAH